MDSFEALCRNQKLGLWWKNRIKYLADDNRQRDARALFLEFKYDERIIRTWLWPFPWLCSRACRPQSSGWIRLWNALNNSKNHSCGAPGMVCIVVRGGTGGFLFLKKRVFLHMCLTFEVFASFLMIDIPQQATQLISGCTAQHTATEQNER